MHHVDHVDDLWVIVNAIDGQVGYWYFKVKSHSRDRYQNNNLAFTKPMKILTK